MKIGDQVRISTVLNANNEPVIGVIVANYDDDSDCLNYPTKYWLVRTNGGNLHDCLEDEIEKV